MKADNTSRGYDTGIVSGSPKSSLTWFRGRGRYWEGKYAQGWFSSIPQSLKRGKRTTLARTISLDSQGLRSSSCSLRWGPCLTHLVWVKIRLYHNASLRASCIIGYVISTFENFSQKHSWHHFDLAESSPNPMTGWFTGLLWGHDYQVMTQKWELNS